MNTFTVRQKRPVIGAESAGAVWPPQRVSVPPSVSTFSLQTQHKQQVCGLVYRTYTLPKASALNTAFTRAEKLELGSGELKQTHLCNATQSMRQV